MSSWTASLPAKHPSRRMKIVITENRDKACSVVNNQDATVLSSHGNTLIICFPDDERAFRHASRRRKRRHHAIPFHTSLHQDHLQVARPEHPDAASVCPPVQASRRIRPSSWFTAAFFGNFLKSTVHVPLAYKHSTQIISFLQFGFPFAKNCAWDNTIVLFQSSALDLQLLPTPASLLITLVTFVWVLTSTIRHVSFYFGLIVKMFITNFAPDIHLSC